MDNLFLYCGLLDAKIKASDKDLPVHYERQIEIGVLSTPKYCEMPAR